MNMSSDSDENQISERKLLRSQLQSKGVMLFVTLASIGDAVITTDDNGEVTFLNPVAEKLTGWSLAEAIGTRIEEVFNLVNEYTGKRLENPALQALSTATKVNIPMDAMLVRKDGSQIPVEDSGAPIQGAQDEILGAILVFRDISERKQSERLLKYRAQLDRTIAHISTDFATTSLNELDSVIYDTLHDICILFDGTSAQVFIYNESTANITCTHEWANGSSEPMMGKTVPLLSLPDWAEKVLKQQPFIILDIEDIPSDAVEERAFWKRRELKSIAIVPMSQGSEVLGFVCVDSVAQKCLWSEDQLRMLSMIANLCTSAISRKYSENVLEAARNRILEIGSRIQQTLLCSVPPKDIPGFDVAALAVPSKGIDGDFYDFLHHPYRCLDVVVGDVMGKGLPAALLAAGAKTEFLRSISHLLVRSPRGTVPSTVDIVADVHRIMTPQLIALDSFATLSYLRFDFITRAVSLVDCGSTRLVKYNSEDRKIEFYSGRNLPLGLAEYDEFQEIKLGYAPGDMFILYSDGVTEARNKEGKFFGLDRLREIIEKNTDQPADIIAEKVKEGVVRFRESESFADDLTCVVIKTFSHSEESYIRDVEELCISSNLSQLRTIRMFFREYCEHTAGLALSKQEKNLIELALNEAASNVIRHAYHGNSDKRINLRIYRIGNTLRLRLMHEGEQFEAGDSVPMPTLDDSKEGGLGLFIMDRSLDKVNYGQDKTGIQYIELVKTIQPQQTGD